MTWIQLNKNDEQQLSDFMQRVAALPSRQVLVDPMQIWWKAQLLRQWDAERRVTAPLDLMQPIEVAAGVACVVFLLYRALPFLF